MEEESRRRTDEEVRKRTAEEEARRVAEQLARDQAERASKAAAVAKPGKAARVVVDDKGDVFNSDFISNWIEMKQKEYDTLRLRPHPYEFSMYYDV